MGLRIFFSQDAPAHAKPQKSGLFGVEIHINSEIGGGFYKFSLLNKFSMSAAASENLGLWQLAECLKSVFEEIKVILESGGQVHELTVENI